MKKSNDVIIAKKILCLLVGSCVLGIGIGILFTVLMFLLFN